MECRRKYRCVSIIQKKIIELGDEVVDIGAVLIIITLIGLFFAGAGIYLWYHTTPATIITYLIYLVIVFIIWMIYCIVQLG